MAQQQPRTIQPPPDLPSMPDVSDTLTGYLRNFSLWCRHGFADKISASTAQPGLFVAGQRRARRDDAALFMVQVKTDGTIVATPVALGSGKP